MGVARSESTFQQMCTKMTTLDVTGRWSVDGEYSTGEPYSYFMELRATEPEGDCSKPLEQWLVGEVTEPWPFKITGKRTRNGVIFQQNAAGFRNLCHGMLSPEGNQLDGMWIQEQDGDVTICNRRSGTFTAVRVADVAI